MPGRERTDSIPSRPMKRRAGVPYQKKPSENQANKEENDLAKSSPPCDACKTALRMSSDLSDAYTAMLTNVKSLFLNDTLHHHAEDDQWLRLTHALECSHRPSASQHRVPSSTQK